MYLLPHFKQKKEEQNRFLKNLFTINENFITRGKNLHVSEVE